MSTEKRNKFYVSLYVSIPFVLAGLAVLFVLLTFRLTEYFIKHGESLTWPIVILACLAGFVLFSFGLLTVWMLFHPVQTFVEKASAFPGMVENDIGVDTHEHGDELYKAVRLFKQVTDALSKVDSKEMFPQIIGESKLIRSVFKQIKKVAPTDSTVLISGESGTGKELVASSIHEHSERRDKPFVKINCVAIPADLLESELFGHEKGAFTGAVSKKIGKFEAAHGGTVFLDEIGDMPLALQAKLLRVLQEKEFERVGGNKSIKVDVRFIAATNKDLFELIKSGKFRDDLYYRLNVFTLAIPPLRDRKEDILPLTRHFLKAHSEKTQISNDALRELVKYNWPGNVRDLKNCLERAVVLNDEGIILPEHLPGILNKEKFEEDILLSMVGGENLDEKLRSLEKSLIVNALVQSGGVQVKAADVLGIKERSLWNRIKKHKIKIEEIRKQFQ